MCKKRTYGVELEGYTSENIRDDSIANWEFIDDGSLHDEDEECGNCEGSGRDYEECEDCNGYGEINCEECEGNGYIECNLCEGEKTIECPDCDGAGCEECDEIGHIECDGCNGHGEERCDECYGNGTQTCRNCDGERTLETECGFCEGTGENEASRYSVECVSTICREGEYEPIDEVFDFIESLDWATDGACGTHIHIGADDLTPTDLSKLYILTNIIEPAIYGVEDASRRTGSYSRPTVSRKASGLLEMKDNVNLRTLGYAYYGYMIDPDGYFNKYDRARYYGLNLHAYYLQKTVEFRYFSGVECRDKTKKLVELCIKIVDFAKHTTFEQLEMLGREMISVTSALEGITRVSELLGLSYNMTELTRYVNEASYAYLRGNMTSEYLNRAV